MKRRDKTAFRPFVQGALSSSGDGGQSWGEKWQPGQLVRSTAGRDQGQYYLVLAVHDQAAILADGRKRPAARPKVKNFRHLQSTHRVAADFAAWQAKGGPTDEQIRAAINTLQKEKE